MAALPQDPDLEQLRNQARELRRAVRRGEPEALTRLAESHPEPAPDAASLRLSAAQLVLARENGFASWARMKRYVEIVTSRAWTPGQPAPEDEPVADRFLRLACLTYSEDHDSDREGAAALLAQNPALPEANLFVAAACCDVGSVRRHLEGGTPGHATGGPYGWSALLYQAYARHDRDVGLEATLETARLLIDAGADPNDGRFWHALPTPFTVLTGVLGYGEHRQPWHPHAIPFARLLLERGADPNDGQALYNRMFRPRNDHLVLLFEFGLGRDTRGPWHRLLGESLESPQVMLRSLLGWAVTHDQRERVALLAANGVDVVSPFTEPRGPGRGTPAEVALTNGYPELAALLQELGAAPPLLNEADAFVAAVMAGDAEAVRLVPEEVVVRVRRRRPGLVTWAAARGAPNSVELLVSAGFDVNTPGRSDIPGNQPWQTALHAAAEKGDAAMAARLLELGADPNLKDKRFSATPLGWTRYFDHPEVAEVLLPVTRQD